LGPVDADVRAAALEASLTEERTRELEAWFERLLAEHGAALGRVAASYEWEPGRRADLVQEIALAIWQALPRFRRECSERTFLFRIAHNRSLTHVWRRKGTAGEPLDAHEPRDPGDAPDELAARQQRRRQLQQAIRSLSIAHRQVLTLMLEDLTNREIAEVLGISEGAVAVRATRARQALKRALGVT
jgi:RNA polymerase sigma-70 factor (ECF subfamily)